MRTVEVAGGPVEVLDLPGDGSRRAVVALHEGLGSVGTWRGFLQDVATATGRRVVAWSRHGHGRSPARSGRRPLDYRQHEAWTVLPALRVALGLDAGGGPVLLGHSDGASIALLHAARYAVAAVVAIAPHVVVEPAILEGIRRTVAAHATLREGLARHHDDADALFAAWSGTWLDPAFAASQDLRDVLAGVGAPVLAVQGTEDAYATLRQLDEVAAHVRGDVTRVELAGAGHAPHRDAPTALLDAIVRFLEDLP